ncbi:hypothetical protein [Salinibacterium sp. SWN167]|uniref:hypothetical protein n=1 Tax=Salinibacterium sp. SWN167 TaxID=2792054 RepID=UPI0018CCFA6A|nr:hypothetical protein [Salinibacterium sp. SWN167]MBH0084344.1 hypothetical protein [Salinibacterium sp. SWN167]
MSELDEHLARMSDISSRANSFKVNEASDPKAFSKTVVEDLGMLADAIGALIKRSQV